MSKQYKVIMKYPGSKAQMLQYIYELIPPHKCWVDVFGGSAVVTLNKKPSKVEIYNDIDDTLVNLMRILADENKFNEFEKRIKYLPYAFTEFNKYKEKYKNNDYTDDVDKAITRWYLGNTSLKGIPRAFQRNNNTNVALTYANKKNSLIYIHNRLKTIVIENIDYEKLINKYDSNQTVFYCDPPYMPETRYENKTYKNDMTNKNHIQFLETMTKIQGKAIISGYNSELYNNYLSNWNKREIEVNASMSMKKLPDRNTTKAIECLWYNYEHNTNFIQYKELKKEDDK